MSLISRLSAATVCVLTLLAPLGALGADHLRNALTAPGTDNRPDGLRPGITRPGGVDTPSEPLGVPGAGDPKVGNLTGAPSIHPCADPFAQADPHDCTD